MSSWTTGLFDCSSDFPNFVVSCLLPWVTIVQNRAEMRQKEAGSVDLCCSCLSNPFADVYNTRQELRSMYNIPDDRTGDCLSSICCMWCMNSQHHRELQARGTITHIHQQDEHSLLLPGEN